MGTDLDVEHATLLNDNIVTNLVVNVEVGLHRVTGSGLELHDQLCGELETSLEGSTLGSILNSSLLPLGFGRGVGLLQLIDVDSGSSLLDFGVVFGTALGNLEGGNESRQVGHFEWSFGDYLVKL